MRAKFLMRICTILFLLAMFIPMRPVQADYVPPVPEAYGFLLPWEAGESGMTVTQNAKTGTCNGCHPGHEIDIVKRSGGNNVPFNILAPKDGVVVAADDRYPESFTGLCADAGSANYLVLGHGIRRANGTFPLYTTYLHIAQGSIPAEVKYADYLPRDAPHKDRPYNRVKVGQLIGVAGNVGQSTTIHLHFHAATREPRFSKKVGRTDCYGNKGVERYWPTYTRDGDTVPVGFEEYNNGTIEHGSPGLVSKASYNHVGLGSNLCDPANDKIIAYEHIGYGGRCKVIPENVRVTDFSQSGGPFLISSMFVRFASNTVPFCTIVISDRADPPFTTVQPVIMPVPSFGSYAGANWNDRIKSVYGICGTGIPLTQAAAPYQPLPPGSIGYAVQDIPYAPQYGYALEAFGGFYKPSLPSWLQDFSISPKLPLGLEVHAQVEWNSDFDAFRVCFNGQECQETSEVNHTFAWDTYQWDDGEYTVTVQYRRHSDNQNWANALEYSASYSLSPHRGPFANCGSGVDGASLTSGSNCTLVTDNVRELDEIEWADRSNLVVSVTGELEAWVYDGPDYQGQPRIIKSGESEAVGNNISSVEIKPLAPPPPPVPTEPFTTDANTLHLWHFDENSGSTVNDSVGSRHGTISNGTWTDGKFGSGLSFPNPPDGRSVTFGTMDVCPLTYETWMKRQPLGNSMGRVAGQEGGGGNSGQNKWLFYFNELIPTLQIFTPNGGSQVFGSKVVSDYEWHYFMVTFDCASHEGNLYMDNELIAELTLPEAWSPGPTTLEMGSAEGIYRCNCFMDEVRISNTVRVPVVPEPDPDPTPTPTPSPTPVPLTNGVELLAAPVHLEGDDGSDGLDWVVPDNTLNGRNMVRVMLDLHGLYPLGGDASALAFSQGPWQLVGLSDYTQGGVDGIQTVHIPLSDFMDLDPSQPMTDAHLRFWYGGPFEVDIYSVYAYTAGNPDTNLALGREATASSIEDTGLEADKAVDGDPTTRWASLESDPEWIMIDLGHEYNITSMRLVWEPAYATMYQVQTSHDGVGWTTVYSTNTGDGDIDYLSDLNTSGRYVKIYGSERATQWCYSLWEVEIYGDNDVVYPPAAPEGLELLNAPITLSGEDGSTEYHQDIPAFALAGMTHVRVTLDLNGLSLYPGDASALAFSQWEWDYVGLAAYVQNGLDGEQTVVIPLADFMDLVPDDEVGDMHMRIWHPNAFNVDVMSIYAFHQD